MDQLFNSSTPIILHCNTIVATQQSRIEKKGVSAVKPIIGSTTYKEISPEEITRLLHEAEILRAEAVRDSLFAAFRGIKSVLKLLRKAVISNEAPVHGSAKPAGL